MDFTPLPHGSVVVGIDGSDQARLALDWAAHQAALEHRPLTVVHASGPTHPEWLGPPAMDLDDLRLVEDRAARSVMQEAVQHVRSLQLPVAVHQVLCRTDPRQELLDHAQRAAMVVVGSRGRGPVRSLLLGSVSVAVSTHSPCPVVVLRPRETGSRPDAPLHGVLVGVQGTDLAPEALELAYRLASSRHQHLTVVQCFWDTGYDGFERIPPAGRPGPRRRSSTEDPRPTRDALLAPLSDLVAGLSRTFPDVVVAVRQQHGFVDQRVVDLSPSMDAVVVGSSQPHLLQRAAYGSVGRTVVEHAEGVVVVVPLASDR